MCTQVAPSVLLPNCHYIQRRFADDAVLRMKETPRKFNGTCSIVFFSASSSFLSPCGSQQGAAATAGGSARNKRDLLLLDALLSSGDVSDNDGAFFLETFPCFIACSPWRSGVLAATHTDGRPLPPYSHPSHTPPPSLAPRLPLPLQYRAFPPSHSHAPRALIGPFSHLFILLFHRPFLSPIAFPALFSFHHGARQTNKK